MREEKPMSLLVRNLRYTTSPDRVRKFFEQFGEVRDVYLPLDYYTKLPRGFGFVEFSRDEDAENALQSLSRHAVLDGAEVSVTVAQQGRKTPDTMRHRDRLAHGGRGRSRSYSGSRRRRRDYSRSRSVDRRRESSYDRRRRSPGRSYRSRGRSSDRRRDSRQLDYPRGHSRSRSRGPRDDLRRPRDESPYARRRRSYHDDRGPAVDTIARRESGSESPERRVHDEAAVQRRSRSPEH